MQRRTRKIEVHRFLKGTGRRRRRRPLGGAGPGFRRALAGLCERCRRAPPQGPRWLYMFTVHIEGEANVAVKRNGESRVTIAQIASESGVSITTVSKVLNHLPGVATDTRARVGKVIEYRQYVQSHAARLLRKSQSGLIDMAIMRLEGGYDLGIMRGVQDALETTRHRLVSFAPPEHQTPTRPL